MKILYVTPNLGNADFLDHEIRGLIPGFQMDVSPHSKDASEKVNLPGRYEAVLLDPDLAEDERLSLIIHVRAHRLPLAVIQILPANDKTPPLKLLKAGADDYIVMRVDSIRCLPGILRRTIEGYSRAKSPDHRPLRVLHAGDIQPALRKLGHLHHIKLSAAKIDDHGSWRNNDGEELNDFPHDVAVLDDTFAGTKVLQYLKDLRTRAPELPVLLLVPPEREETALYALKMGAAQCVLKTGEYFERLLEALEKAIRLRDLARENVTLLDKELRLQYLIETVPASIIVMACDGTVMAVNRTGLEALDIQSPDWLVGKRFTRLIDSQHRKEFSSFLERICGGASDSIVCPCTTANGTDRSLEFRAVPHKRDDDLVTVLCSFHENHRADQPGLESKLHDLAQQLESSEEERSTLREELQSAETARAELLKAGRQDRELLEGITRELEQARSTIEEIRLSAEEEKTRQERLLEEERIRGEEKIRGLGERLEGITRELEQARSTIEEIRLSAEEEKIRQERLLEEEKIRREEEFGELGKRLEASEEERLSLQGALESAQEAQAKLSEEAEQNQTLLDRLSEELDRSQSALEELRLSAEEQRSQLAKQLEEEAARGEAAGRELREQLEESEKKSSALDESLKSIAEAQERVLEERQEIQRDMEITRARLEEIQAAFDQERLDTAGKHEADRTEWSNKVLELERHLEASAEQGRRLDETLGAVQADHERLQLEYSESRSRWENEQRRLEQRCVELEEARSTALDRARQIEEDYESGRADERVKLAALGDEKVLLEDALRKAEIALVKLAEEHEKEITSRQRASSKMEKDLKKSDERRDELESKMQALQTHYVETVKEQQAELSTLRGQHLEQQEKLKRAQAVLAEYQASVGKPVMDSSRQKGPPQQETVPGEELAEIGLEAGRTGKTDSQPIDSPEEIRLLLVRIETLRSMVQEQLTARRSLTRALQALAVRHREMIGFRRRDRARLEALGAELAELRAGETRQSQTRNVGPSYEEVLPSS